MYGWHNSNYEEGNPKICDLFNLQQMSNSNDQQYLSPPSFNDKETKASAYRLKWIRKEFFLLIFLKSSLLKLNRFVRKDIVTKIIWQTSSSANFVTVLSQIAPQLNTHASTTQARSLLIGIRGLQRPSSAPNAIEPSKSAHSTSTWEPDTTVLKPRPLGPSLECSLTRWHWRLANSASLSLCGETSSSTRWLSIRTNNWSWALCTTLTSTSGIGRSVVHASTGAESRLSTPSANSCFRILNSIASSAHSCDRALSNFETKSAKWYPFSSFSIKKKQKKKKKRTKKEKPKKEKRNKSNNGTERSIIVHTELKKVRINLPLNQNDPTTTKHS